MGQLDTIQTRETRQVDSKIPRGKAAFHTILPATAFLLGDEIGVWIVAFTAIAMTVSVLGGPKVSLFGRLFTGVIKPIFKIQKGKPEELAPHKFAETLGAVFLLLASSAFLVGSLSLGWGIAVLVAALAALNWLGGICVGCQVYLLARRINPKSKVTSS